MKHQRLAGAAGRKRRGPRWLLKTAAIGVCAFGATFGASYVLADRDSSDIDTTSPCARIYAGLLTGDESKVEDLLSDGGIRILLDASVLERGMLEGYECTSSDHDLMIFGLNVKAAASRATFYYGTPRQHERFEAEMTALAAEGLTVLRISPLSAVVSHDQEWVTEAAGTASGTFVGLVEILGELHSRVDEAKETR